MLAGNQHYRSEKDVPSLVPVFPLSGALLLPGGQIPLNIFEPRFLAMIDHAMATDRVIVMVQPRLKAKADAQETDNNGPTPLCEVGCLGRISSFNETGDGRYVISLQGICRVRLDAEVKQDEQPFRQFNICPFVADLSDLDENDTIDREQLLKVFREYLEFNQLEADWDSVEKAENMTLVNALSMMSPFGPAEKQALLEAPDMRTRAETLVAITEISLARDGDEAQSMLQ